MEERHDGGDSLAKLTENLPTRQSIKERDQHDPCLSSEAATFQPRPRSHTNSLMDYAKKKISSITPFKKHEPTTRRSTISEDAPIKAPSHKKPPAAYQRPRSLTTSSHSSTDKEHHKKLHPKKIIDDTDPRAHSPPGIFYTGFG